MTDGNIPFSTGTTRAIIQWVQSRCVLAHRMWEVPKTEGEFDLVHAVVDLLAPDRSTREAQVLQAVGVSPEDADALWYQLSGGDTHHWQWVDSVDWSAVRRALEDQHLRMRAWDVQWADAMNWYGLERLER